MSAQVIGPRKHRLVEERTGLKFDRVLRLSNQTWEGRIITPSGHSHVRINTQDWATEFVDGPHWSSCRDIPSDTAATNTARA